MQNATMIKKEYSFSKILKSGLVRQWQVETMTKRNKVNRSIFP